MAENRTQIILTAKDDTQSAFNSVIGRIKQMESGLSGMGAIASKVPMLGTALTAAFSGVKFTEFINNSIDAADQLDKLAQKTGTSVEALAGLKYAAEQNDASLESVADAAKKLAVNMAESPQLFKQLGINSKDTTGALIELSDVFSVMPDGANKTALAVKLLGKSGADMIPMLNNGSAALKALVDTGQKLNPVTAESARQAGEFKDNMEVVKSAVSGVGTEIANQLLPNLASTSAHMADLAKEGKLFAAAMVGLGGAMQLPWDLLIPPTDLKKELSVDGQLKDLQVELGNVKRALESTEHGGLLQKWLYGSNDELQQKQRMIEAQIETLKRHRAELSQAPAEAPKTEALDQTGLVNGYAALIEKMKERKTMLSAELANEAALSDTEKFRVKILADLENGTLKFTAVQKADVRARLDGLAALDKENQSRKESAIILAQQAAMMNSLTGDFDLQTEATRRNMTVMSESQRALAVEMDKIAKAEDRARQAAIKDYNTNKDAGRAGAADAYKSSLEKITEETLRQREVTRQLAEEQEKLNGSWKFGAETAMQSYIDMARNTAKQTESMFGKSFKAMEDSLVSFVKTGKLNMESFADVVITELIRIQVQKTIAGIAGMFIAGNSTTGIPKGTNASAGNSYFPTMLSANGSYFDGHVAAFANGGIVNSPTTFRFASGGSFRNGLMGEAGPEAIMPLKRDATGRLGVSMVGSSGAGGDVAVNVVVNANTGESQTSGDNSALSELGNRIGNVVRGVLVDEMRPGGLLAGAA